MLQKTKSFLKTNGYVLLTVAVSIVAWGIVFRRGLTTVSNEAILHVDTARSVVDGRQSGLRQLGGVTPPLHQLLSLPFVLNSWMWHSGLAGSIVSMAAFVAAAVIMYRLAIELKLSKYAALITASVFALNVNMLYLQATPLNVSLYLAAVLLSLLFLVHYINTDNAAYLAFSSIAAVLQIADGYGGWLIAAVELCTVIYYAYVVRKHTAKETLGVVSLYVIPIVYAILAWLLWNFFLYGNPLHGFIDMYHSVNRISSLHGMNGKTYMTRAWRIAKELALSILENAGVIVTAVGMLGWLVYICFEKSKQAVKWTTLIVLLSIVLTGYVALVLGMATLHVPAFHINPMQMLVGTYSNAEYGIVALPLIALGFGFLATKLRKGAFLLAVVVLLQGILLLHSGVVTVAEADTSKNTPTNQDIANVLSHEVTQDQGVLISQASFGSIIFSSHVDLHNFITENDVHEWSYALSNPYPYAQWIVMANASTGDPVHTALVTKERNLFLKYYTVVYSGKQATLYERKDPSQVFVTAKGTSLMEGSDVFTIHGINSYDLAYQSNSVIDTTFQELSKAGVNTIRFWLFGDGEADGFQPSAGVINSDRMQSTDYIFAEANRYHMHLLPTLTNNWTDYGGMDQYLEWVGLPTTDHDAFYTNSTVIALYENYVNHILTHVNSITGIAYNHDPAVLAWDIANEPRVTDTADSSSIVTWVSTIASYVRTIDNNHLITVSLDGPTLQNQEASICAVRDIDFCSAHLYVQEQGQATPVFSSRSQEGQIINSIKTTANKDGRPVVMSEIGIDKSTMPFGQPPLSVLSWSLHNVVADNYSGFVIWNWSQTPDPTYGFSTTGMNGQYTIQDLAHLMQNP
jgi:hypothetical protein